MTGFEGYGEGEITDHHQVSRLVGRRTVVIICRSRGSVLDIRSSKYLSRVEM